MNEIERYIYEILWYINIYIRRRVCRYSTSASLLQIFERIGFIISTMCISAYTSRCDCHFSFFAMLFFSFLFFFFDTNCFLASSRGERFWSWWRSSLITSKTRNSSHASHFSIVHDYETREVTIIIMYYSRDATRDINTHHSHSAKRRHTPEEWELKSNNDAPKSVVAPDWEPIAHH